MIKRCQHCETWNNDERRECRKCYRRLESLYPSGAAACSPMPPAPETLALLNRELAGEPITIGDWTTFARQMERERDDARRIAESFRHCAESKFGPMPFPRKFHWENAIAQTPPDSGTQNHG